MKAKVITFEGIDGAGKSTLIKKLHAHFVEQGKEVWSTQEPWHLDKLNADPFIATLELMTDRRRHCEAIKWTDADIILIDRFDLSTEAYQGYGDGVSREMIGMLNDAATEGVTPAMRIWLDVPVSVAVQRLIDRGDPPSVDDIVRLERVRDGYSWLLHRFTMGGDIRKIDANQSPEEVFRDAVRLIEEVL